MSYWLDDPDLFLYAKGTGSNDVHLWRCKKPVSSSSSSSSLLMPMKPDDFEYVSNVKNHVELIGDVFGWDETDYKRLVTYIFERRLLVNNLGFVIAELLHKVVDQQNGNKMIDDANEEVPVIYIRSLDILALKPYIPNLRELPIPLRTVHILEDENGKAAVMEDDDNSNLAKRVVDLELENKTLEGKVTKLNTDFATRTSEWENSQRKLNQFKKAYMEVWMNDALEDWNGSNEKDWKGIEKLPIDYPQKFDSVAVVGGQGSFLGQGYQLYTNVDTRYLYKVKGRHGPDSYIYMAVCIDELHPNKESARFAPGWKVCTIQGKKYVILTLHKV